MVEEAGYGDVGIDRRSLWGLPGAQACIRRRQGDWTQRTCAHDDPEERRRKTELQEAVIRERTAGQFEK